MGANKLTLKSRAKKNPNAQHCINVMRELWLKRTSRLVIKIWTNKNNSYSESQPIANLQPVTGINAIDRQRNIEES